MSARDPIVARAKVLRRIRVRRRATLAVAVAAIAASGGLVACAYLIGGDKGALFMFGMASLLMLFGGVGAGAGAPDGWWADVLGLTDPDPED